MRLTRFSALLVLALALLGFSSCKKFDELLDPKNGDDKLQDLLTGKPWNVDTLQTGTMDLSNHRLPDTTYRSYGTLTFWPRSKETGSNYGVGLVQHRYDTPAGPITDTLYWYAGNWGSISLEGKVVTLFMSRLPDHSFDSNSDLHLDFLLRSDNKIILDGNRSYTNLSNGANYGFYRRYSLSR